MDPDIYPSEPELGTQMSKFIPFDFVTRDLSEFPGLDDLHIDEVEPPSPGEKVPSSPATPTPAPDSSYLDDRYAKASKGTKTQGNRAGPESMRARAEEVNSGSKFVPKIEEPVCDYFGLEIELATWFTESGIDMKQWIDDLVSEHKKSEKDMSTVRQILYQLLIHQSAPTVTHAVKDMVEKVVSKKKTYLDLVKSLQPTEDFDELTFMYVCLCALQQSREHMEDKCLPPLASDVRILSSLIAQVASMRWFVEADDDECSSVTLLSRLFKLIRMCVLTTFGNSRDLHDAEVSVWKQYKLEMPENADEYSSPINYAEFMEEISKRYPAFIVDQGDSDKEHDIGASLRNSRYNGAASDDSNCEINGGDGNYDPTDPRDLVHNSSSVMPYVPHSIIEACELYKSRVRTSPAILQLHEVQSSELDKNKPSSAVLPGSIGWRQVALNVPVVSKVDALYEQTIGVQKSFVRVVVDYVMQAGKAGPSPNVHAALSSIWHLLRWFRVGHILMFEHLCALLFDSQFHLVVHSFCSAHSHLASYILEPYVECEHFWSLVTDDSAEYDGPVISWSTKDTAQLAISHFNRYKLQTFTHLMGISRSIVSGKTQRLLVVSELPVDPLKSLFSIYEDDLWQQLLQYMKAQVPFTGKRWRYLNMELISAIYLHCPSRIDDNWLSGNDMTQVVRNARAEEITLRRLVEKFHTYIR